MPGVLLHLIGKQEHFKLRKRNIIMPTPKKHSGQRAGKMIRYSKRSSSVYFHSISHYNKRMCQFEIGALSDTPDFIGGGRGGSVLRSHHLSMSFLL